MGQHPGQRRLAVALALEAAPIAAAAAKASAGSIYLQGPGQDAAPSQSHPAPGQRLFRVAIEFWDRPSGDNSR